MKRHTVLKIRFIVGIIIASFALIGFFVHYLKKQHVYAENTIEYTDIFREKSLLVNSFKNELLHINHAKMAIRTSNSSDAIHHINTHSHHAKEYLKQIVTPNSLYDQHYDKLHHLQDLFVKITRIDWLEKGLANQNIDAQPLSLPLEEQEIHHTCDDFVQGISYLSSQKIESEKQTLHKTLNLLVLIGIIALLTIGYIIYDIIKIVEKIRSLVINEKKVNADFTSASKQVEDNTWILQRTNEIYESISGIDDVKIICSNALKSIIEASDNKAYAGAIYIRDTSSDMFMLHAKHGFAKEDVELEFEKGDGLLGEAVQDIDCKIYDTARDKNIRLNTTFITTINPSIILAPMHHDGEILGLLELAGSFAEGEQEKILEYLKRATRTISSYVKFGQSHTFVEKLLEQTQKQTEELEAQQEELRITNEELIYKTNLLESSEEELRVQQEELSQANKELNQKAEELHKRNVELSQAQVIVEQKISEVQQASKYKTEFMANMSHELRTPLNSVLILAKLLQDNKNKNLTDDQVKYASVIHSAGSDLLELINELLDLAKIEAGKVDIMEETITSKHFKENLESLFKEIAEQKNIRFSIDIEEFPEQFISDEHRLEQIIKNFLSNAFKFTEQDGIVQVHFHLKDNYLHFKVSDSGKGISKEKQETIFEAFRQEDGSTSRKYGGTGLGLTISRELAMLLDGYITLESELGKGSIFTLVIPFQSQSKTRNDRKPTSSVNHPKALPEITPEPLHLAQKINTDKSRTILIIEDDFNFADILKDFAENYDFDVLLAYDGAKGIEVAKKNLPDAIILDVMLPISDGWEVLRQLKEDESTKHIPIHMMSAANYNPKEILEKGAIGFLSKPVSEDKIQEVFSNILLNIDKDVKKLLLIEDQEVLSDFIKNTFAERNINVIQAFTLELALKKLIEEDNIDCVILDISLPDGNGLKLLEEIKNNPTLKHIPVIINTAEELTVEQTEKIARYTKSMVLKNGKSTNRLIDEVNLFLSKINDEDYRPIRNAEKLDHSNYLTNSPLSGKRVLIVDDDMRNVFALTTSLQDHDMEIEIANNGHEALNIINAPDSKFDIVLMDVMMPEMDGYEAIEHIRKEKRHNKLPIIAVTAKAMKGDREKSLQIGANDYISKPIDMNKLLSLMRVWLS